MPVVGEGVVSCIHYECHQASHQTVWPMPVNQVCDVGSTWTAVGTDPTTGAGLYDCK